MRAARVHAWGQAPVVEDVPVPTPGPGEALVRVEAASVAHLDVTVASGEFGIKPTLPYTGGVEGSGIVVESAAFPPGTKVVLRGGGLGLFKNGTWAEYVVVKDKALVEVPHGLSPEVAATFWVPTTTAHTALVDVGRLVPGRHFAGCSAVSVVSACFCRFCSTSTCHFSLAAVVSTSISKRSVMSGVTSATST